MLRRLGGVALAAACAYTAADAAADSAMYMRAKSLVQERAASNGRFAAEIGEPLQLGPWYNSSVMISHDGHVANVTIPVRGSRRSSDVTVRAVRQGGLRSTLLYNTLGGGEWEVLVMNALIGMGPGGVPISMSLLDQPEADPAAAASAAAAATAMGHGQLAHRMPQQRQQLEQQPAAHQGGQQVHASQQG